ncbi:hypothetical protein M5G22_13460 [Pseudomonas sp. TNT2022 ID233]|uniref:hypothetical protein n=1 Tax=Pseudomonas aphyarum TaxID=2942629 RepID=UPI002362AEE9|nr:hypothetical protein [Pseudomonas aphyarum]MDD1138555.1 hypothetical protein [Pseudomonas aphyarum]
MDQQLEYLLGLIRPKKEQFSAMCIVSMDHSPSEQLSESDWYTTAIIVSPTTEHSDLAFEMAAALRPREKTLVKWNKATKNYKRRFLTTLTNNLKDNPSCIFAVSAHKKLITALFPQILSQTGLESLYKVESNEKKRTVTFGPFYRYDTHKEEFLTISENRAVMAFFIAHFFLRVFQAIRTATAKDVGWSVFMDKFPGDIDGDMTLLFNCILDGGQREGNITRGSFGESDTEGTDLLADNIAGLLSGMVKKKMDLPIIPGMNGFIYWERYSPL